MGTDYHKLVSDAVDAELEKQKAQGNKDFAYAYISGCLIACLTFSLQGNNESSLRILENMKKQES